MIPKYLKPITDKLKNIDIFSERNFRRDWKIILVSGFIVVIIAVIFIWYFYVSMVTKLAEVQAGSRTVLTINRSTMDKIVSFYKDQEKLFNEAKSSTAKVSDPSK